MASDLLGQDFLETFRSRKLLLSAPAPANSSFDTVAASSTTTFDANVVMVLSVLLCALICSLGVNSIIKCALRCSSIAAGRTAAAERSSSGGSSAAARQANTGIKKKALKTFPVISYAADAKMPGLDTDCAICLSEFAAGDRVRLLPKCNHGFHVRCIDKWLSSHSSCPTCRHCLIQTCQKIVGCTAAAATQPPTPATPPPVPATVVLQIEPLHREGLIPNYHN
ncbi:PREDICTED: RING-H2 finger protein ATL78-like [Ipomoea nil]|uniref:RING-H2 finger protein ATL78-like n=1 Tax=Ipomoea nil TaxID=35883 RepID=UPI000900AA5B|nr:PREDICTED: RING-H2 finger protein ATL78-like [Ipomoea nil]